MSDTPITNKACGWPVGHHGRIDSSDLKLSPDGPFVHSSVAREVERENAALREDKERLDWMASADYWADIAVYRTPKGLRAAIDAARKEAQPWGDDQIMRQHLSEGGTPT